MVDVHGLADGQSVRPEALFKNLSSLLVRVSLKARQGWSVHRPIRIRVNGHNPNRRPLKPPAFVQIAACITGRVAFFTHGNVFDQISAAVDGAWRALLSRSRSRL